MHGGKGRFLRVCAVYLEVTVFISRSVISSIDAAYCHFCSAAHQLFFLLQQLHSLTARVQHNVLQRIGTV